MASPLLKSQPKDASGVPVTDFKMLMLLASAGQLEGFSTVHKFGRNVAVGTSLVPVCDGGIFNTPQFSSPVTLEAISDDVNDTAAGSGAREVTIQYIDATTKALTNGTFTMNGTSASTTTVSNVARLLRAWVSASGTYASTTAESMAGTITIRVASAGATWATLSEFSAAAFGGAQSLIGAYTVPTGKTAYILAAEAVIDTGKSVDLYFFKRENADQTSAPYSAMRVANSWEGITDKYEIEHNTFESYPALTDIGFMAHTSTGTAGVSIDFELLLVDD